MARLCPIAGDETSLRSLAARDTPEAQCTSLKANMGHLEACAAAAGLGSLLATPLAAAVVPGNSQLRRWETGRLEVLPRFEESGA